jgi:CBS domain containing-hemolysin-like protein
MSIVDVIVIVVLLLANGFFVAFEFALVASRRTRLDQRVEGGSRAAVRAIEATQRLGEHIAGVQLGVTMASLGLGAVAEPVIGKALESLAGDIMPEHYAKPIGFTLALLLTVFLHSVIGEMVPKRMALLRAESTLVALALPMRGFVTLFGPIIRVLDGVAAVILKLFRVEKRDELFTGGTAEEIARLLHVSHERGMIGGDHHEMLAGAIAFAERKVCDVMVPRSEVVTIAAGCTRRDAVAAFRSSGHSRLPVLGRRGELIGFVHAKDLVAASAGGATSNGDGVEVIAADSIRRMLVVDDERRLDEVLLAMRGSRIHAALVTDGDGATVGFVTLEDLLEELVGEIADETDR